MRSLSYTQHNLLKSIPGWSERIAYKHDSSNKKQQLLDMARRGDPRPSQTTKLGQALFRYTHQISPHKCYDQEFANQLKKTAPQWWLSFTIERKRQLLDMARRGDPKPSSKDKFYASLNRYTNPRLATFDPQFNIEIKKLAPNWFHVENKLILQQKQFLLEMARNRKPRPPVKSKVGKQLTAFTAPKSPRLDLVFTNKIKKIAPLWFRDSTAEKYKNKMLKMAKTNKPKPRNKHPLAKFLGEFTRSNSDRYDPDFTAEINNLAPHWLADTVAEKKQQLLDMARRNEPKPILRAKNTDPLAIPLHSYIRKSSAMYDPDFTAEINNLAPHWLADTVAEKKQQLLDMARQGCPRPHRPLYAFFYVYTKKGNSSYDHEFTTEISKLAPHWLPNREKNKRILLDMAKKGQPRPHYKENKRLYYLLNVSTFKDGGRYDPKFDAEIRKLAPHWFKK